jgi:hypothetical protein
VRRNASKEGTQAEILLVEPNGDEHPEGCLCRLSNTEIFGETVAKDYLNSRYGQVLVSFVSRVTTLSHGY